MGIHSRGVLRHWTAKSHCLLIYIPRSVSNLVAFEYPTGIARAVLPFFMERTFPEPWGISANQNADKKQIAPDDTIQTFLAFVRDLRYVPTT